MEPAEAPSLTSNGSGYGPSPSEMKEGHRSAAPQDAAVASPGATSEQKHGENGAGGSSHIVQLEFKVVELERKLTELERALQDERKIHSLQVTAKTSMIDALRIKVNRLEFAIKEAIIFLSKPLERMQNVLASGIQKGGGGRGSTSSRIEETKKQEESKKIDDAKRNENSKRSEGAKKQDDSKKGRRTGGAQQDQQPQQAASVLSPLEGECLECMRFSIQYLQKAQAATSHISPAGHAKQAAVLSGFPERRRSDDELMPLSNLVIPAVSVPSGGSCPSTPSVTLSPPSGPPDKPPGTQSNHSVWITPKSTTTTAASKRGSWAPPGSDDTPDAVGACKRASAHTRSKSAPLSAATAALMLASGSFGSSGDMASGDIGENSSLSAEMGSAHEVGLASPEGASKAQFSAANAETGPFGSGNRGTLSGSRCLHCRELLLQIDKHHDIQTELKREIGQLEQQLAQEQQELEQMTLSKQLLEQEMEDLTASLFDQANRMVMEETAMRDALEKKNKELEGKLESTLSSVTKREEELKMLRKSLKQDLARRRSLSRGASSLNLNIDAANAATAASAAGRRSPSRGTSQTSLGSIEEHEGAGSAMRLPRFAVENVKEPNAVHIDGAAYSEFQEHIKAAAKATASTYATLGSSFLKRVMAEDIEPCLFQGSTAWKMPFYRNRLLLAIIKDTVEIRHWSFKLTTDSELEESSGIAAGFGKMLGFSRSGGGMTGSTRKHSPTGSGSASSKAPVPQAPHVKCWSCGVPRDCEFQIRLDALDSVGPSPAITANFDSASIGHATVAAPESADSWQPLDRFCKDRIVAVCDFYVYLSQLRQGMLGKNIPLLGMFRQSMWYRRRMGLARIGSLELFDGMDAQGVTRLGVRDLEGKVISIIR